MPFQHGVNEDELPFTAHFGFKAAFVLYFALEFLFHILLDTEFYLVRALLSPPR